MLLRYRSRGRAPTHEAGHLVYTTARHPHALTDLADIGMRPLVLGVTDASTW